MKSQPIANEIHELYQTFESEYEDFVNKQKKSSAKRAKKAITSLKKLVSPFRAAIKEDVEGIGKATTTQEE
jgi:hypothetical protein